jgi:hypothetical protein
MELIHRLSERDKRRSKKLTGLEALVAGGNTGHVNLGQFAWRP